MKNDWPTDGYYAGYPDTKVRVAMNKPQKYSQRSRARCCTPSYNTIPKRMDSTNQEFLYVLERFLDNPVCALRLINGPDGLALRAVSS